jgi:DNA polymerase-3 subunit epsilon
VRLHLTRPLVTIDVETTGTWRKYDRVVQVAYIILRPDGSRLTYNTLVNPGRPIPAEATAIHHITDAMVADAPTWATVGPIVADALKDADVCGKNVKFDLEMIQEACARERVPFFGWGQVIDIQRLWQILEPRTLEDAVRRFCGRPMDGAHDALVDVTETLNVLDGQMEEFTGPDDARLPNTVPELAALCQATRPGALDPDGIVVFRDGHARWSRGKHEGEPFHGRPEYLGWVLRAGAFTPEVRALARRVQAGERLGPPDGMVTGETPG